MWADFIFTIIGLVMVMIQGLSGSRLYYLGFEDSINALGFVLG